jgi:hypothetical protein
MFELNDTAGPLRHRRQTRCRAVDKGQRVAVRVISQFGEESTKVLVL